MDSFQLKEYIFENKKIEYVLQKLGMHSIIFHNSTDRNKQYYSCGMPDGDNKISTNVFNNSFINVKAYTRDIEDIYGHSDLISLVSFIKKYLFWESIKWLCEILELDYYGKLNDDLPKSLQWIKKVKAMNEQATVTEDEEVKPISEIILTYYEKYSNDIFANDGISCKTQREFEIGYDPCSNRITIPIRDEFGTLVGVKGRIYKESIEDGFKYIYLEPCAKSKILYGIHKTLPYIKEKNEVIVVESEKGVMQLWNIGIKNVVAISGHDMSRSQMDKLIRLGVDIVLAYDKDVDIEIIEKTLDKFIQGMILYYLYDNNNILDEKQSPSDDIEKWHKLYNNKFQYIQNNGGVKNKWET